MRLIDLTGQVFGRLTVIERADYIKDKHSKRWVCQCSCGHKTVVRSTCLRRPEPLGTRSCGCINPMRLRSYEALYRRFVRDNTRLRNIAVHITYEEFLEFTKVDKCFYCYVPIVWKEFCSGQNGYNLDRKDNDNVYTKDNLVVCCKRCNLGKRDTYTFEEWYGMTAYFREKEVYGGTSGRDTKTAYYACCQSRREPE